jgi:alcohol dehydrogenase class IV
MNSPTRKSFDLLDLERVTWGEALVPAVVSEVTHRGSVRPLLVTSPTSRKMPAVDTLLSDLPGRFVRVFAEIVPHVSRPSVMNLISAVREARADLIVTIGGGSAIDTVKVALAGLAADIRTADDLDALAIRYTVDGERIAPRLPPSRIRQVVAPTTLSGAEFSDLAGCTDARMQVKQLFSGRSIGSASVILDPAITVGTPLDIWLSTGVRSLDHAVETLCSFGSNPYADALSADAVRRLAPALRRTYQDASDLGARSDAQLSVWMACIGLNRIPWGASHGLGHQVGAVAGIPHGYCSCILLPHVLAFNWSINAERQALVASAMGHPGGDASEAIARLVADLGLPSRLRDVGITREMLPQIAATSMGNMFVRQNPRPIRSPEDLQEILDAAF